MIMQKQTSRTATGRRPVREEKRRLRRPPITVDLRELLAQQLVDNQELLGTDTTLALSLVLTSNPGGFREMVDELTRTAESSLAEGGFNRYVALRQINALLEKNVDWYAKTAKERRNAALRGFLQSEAACRRANRRLKHYRKHTSRMSEAIRTVMCDARMLCQEILGRLDEATWGEILDEAGFGPGATLEHSVEYGTLAEKLAPSYKHSATETALPYVLAYGHRNPHWVNYLCVMDATYTRTRGDRITTVPKKWDKDRTIGIPPSLNAFLQKGVGVVMERRLRKFGVTLNDQRPNQAKAREGSISGEIATVDLRGASDHDSYELVDWFLPSDWLVVLDSLRSAEYRIGRHGEWSQYEKFSAMGNGFTFPLESLLFYCVTKACVRYCGSAVSDIRVFGDDITVPWDAALLTIEALAFLGFQTNRDKTHIVGYFRESCGADYVNGVDVRPVYLDKCPRGVMEIFDLHNRLLAGQVTNPLASCSYLRSLVPDGSPIPGDFGLALLDKQGWFPGKTIRVSQGFITDPPDPSGWCSSYQAAYWTFQEWVIRHPELKAHERPHWYAEYLAFLKGALGEHERNAKTTVVYRREGFSFTWLTVGELRGERNRRRLKDPLRA